LLTRMRNILGLNGLTEAFVTLFSSCFVGYRTIKRFTIEFPSMVTYFSIKRLSYRYSVIFL